MLATNDLTESQLDVEKNVAIDPTAEAPLVTRDFIDERISQINDLKEPILIAANVLGEFFCFNYREYYSLFNLMKCCIS